MEMHQIRYFLAIARCLNFTRAAEDLQIAQPSLTRAIHKLESELGGPLFRRERRHTHLTELGRMVLPDLQATLAAAEAAKFCAHRLKTHDVGSLALGVSIGLDTEAVIGQVVDVAQSLKGLEISVEVAPGVEIRDRLIGGDFDAAILSFGDEAGDRLDLLPMETDAPVVVFASDHRFREEKEVELQDVLAEPQAVFSHGSAEGALLAAIKSTGLVWRPRYRSNEPRWIAELVRRGLAIAVMSATMAGAFGLCHRRLRGVSTQQRSMLAVVAGRRHSRAVAKLVQQTKRLGAPPVAAVAEAHKAC